MTTPDDFNFPAANPNRPQPVIRINAQDRDSLKDRARSAFDTIMLVSDKHPDGMQINHLTALLKKIQTQSQGTKLSWFKRTLINLTGLLAAWAAR